jgi:hypothetical protein
VAQRLQGHPTFHTLKSRASLPAYEVGQSPQRPAVAGLAAPLPPNGAGKLARDQNGVETGGPPLQPLGHLCAERA